MEVNDIEWDQLVEDLGPRLYRYFSASFSASVASDAVQECFVRLVQKTRNGDYQSDKGSLAAYAFGIAHWVRIEFLKKIEFQLVDDESGFDRLPNQNLDPAQSEPQQKLAHLRWAISQLKATEQEILLLAIDSELELSEIATQLSLPLGTIKSHIHRAKENLKKIMEVHDEQK